MTDDTRDLMNEYVQAWLEGDVEEMALMHADDLVLHQSGSHPLAGDHEGRLAYFELLARISQSGTDMQILELGDLEARGDDAAVTVRLRLRNGNDVVDTDRTTVYRIANGRIAEMWTTDHNQAAVDAFFARHVPG